MNAPRLLLIAAAVLALAGCDSPRRALDALDRDVDAYIAAPSEDLAKKVDASLSAADRQIAELASKEGSSQSEVLQLVKARDACVARYVGARAGNEVRALRDAVKGVGESVKEAGRAFGEALRGQTNGSR